MFAHMLRALAALVLLSGCTNAEASGPRLDFLGTLVWDAADHGFGGFSAIELSDDGRDFTVISDRARILRGALLRNAEERLTGARLDSLARLEQADGTILRRLRSDSEGLAIAGNGTLYISFEGDHRVSRDGVDLPAAPFADLQTNSGLEALAIDAKGRPVTLPERSGQLTRPFPLWRFEAGQWTEVAQIPRRGGFLPVGADFGPDGWFYLLEREFTGFAFKSRIRRFRLAETGIAQEQTLLTTFPLRHDNLEGLATWTDSTGATRLTLISDDNFNALQSTQFVEYRVIEAP